jgi:hypothetical protein
MILFVTILGQKGEIDNRGFYPAGEADGNYCFRHCQGPADSSRYRIQPGIPKTTPVHNFLRLFTLN